MEVRVFYGGMWSGGRFRYNTAVSRVNVRIVHNTYVNNSFYRNNNRFGFNGRGGATARPGREEQLAARERHFNATRNQLTMQHNSARNKAQFARNNHGKPAVASMRRATDRLATIKRALQTEQPIMQRNKTRIAKTQQRTAARQTNRAAVQQRTAARRSNQAAVQQRTAARRTNQAAAQQRTAARRTNRAAVQQRATARQNQAARQQRTAARATRQQKQLCVPKGSSNVPPARAYVPKTSRQAPCGNTAPQQQRKATTAPAATTPAKQAKRKKINFH